jgi:3D (Asp-Asp-Asp) domain-containing protein
VTRLKKPIGILIIISTVLLISVTAFAAPEDKLIKQGTRGDDVQYVQRLLADAGFYAGTIDGIFGFGTTNAVKAFQQSVGLPTDGVVGKETVKFLERAGAAPSRYSRTLTMAATAYTAYDDGNGSYTYRGNFLRKGLAAVDPSVIPLGTRLYIEGYGYAIADDIGGAIKGNKIDLAFENRNDALRFGVQKVMVYILD